MVEEWNIFHKHAPRKTPGWIRQTTGIGSHMMARTLYKVLQSNKIDQIILFGCCGALAGWSDVGDILEVIEAVNADAIQSQTVYLGESVIAHPVVKIMPRTELKRATAISTDSFVDSRDRVKILCAGRKLFEVRIADMETYTAAWIANKEGIPFTCIRQVSDIAGPSSSEKVSEWVNWPAKKHKPFIKKIIELMQ